MTAVDPIVVEVGEAPISVTVASTGLVLSVASGTVGPAGPKGDTGATGPAGATGATGATGPAGATGATGAAGQGVPVGGTTGQVLAKASGTNYDTEWVDQTGGGGGGSGTVTEVSGTAPISVATGTTTPVVSIAAATTSAAGSMSAADKTKLDGVATGATANSTDAQLRDRSTHTGTQALSTISDAGTLAGKSTITSADITDGTIVNGDISASAAIAASKISGLATIATSGSASDLSAGTVPSARLATGTADSTTFLRGDGAWATPSATVADGSVTTAKLADSAVTSAKIENGTIVNEDISASAAIATSKISGLATVATSGSASDLSAGTVPSARLATKVVGGQDEGAGVTLTATAASLLDSTITLPACAAGDLILVAGSFTVLNNSTASRTYTVNLKVGSTNITAVGAGAVGNTVTRSFMFQSYLRVEGTSDLNATTFIAHSTGGTTSLVANAAGVATENIGTGSLALDLTVASSTGTATQTGTLESITVTRIAA